MLNDFFETVDLQRGGGGVVKGPDPPPESTYLSNTYFLDPPPKITWIVH